MTCSVDACNNPGDERTHKMLLSLCRAHGLQVADLYADAVIHKEDARRAAQALRTQARDQAQQGNRYGDPVVYYAAIGDYIKIGYSTRLRDRLATLRADRLLAWEPGGRELEQMRHTDFAASRIDLRRENFRPTPALTAHVAALRELHPLPTWATRPRTTEITTRTEDS